MTISHSISIYDHDGYELAEIEASIEVNWILNEYGNASFTLPVRDPKCTEVNLRYGNFVLVRFRDENNAPVLPDWCGMIDTPREWLNQQVKISCYSAEYILTKRTGTRDETVTGVAGALFQRCINRANEDADTLIRLGNVYGGGSERQLTFHYQQIYKAVTGDGTGGLAQRAENDFEIVPDVQQSGRLQFLANWYERAGVDRLTQLIEGYNIERTTVREQGRLTNDLVGYGDGATWPDRPVYHAKDQELIGKYGLMKDSFSAGASEYGTVRVNTEQEIARRKQPTLSLRLAALDVADTYANIRLGDRLPLRLTTAGFADANGEIGLSTVVRIVGMKYNTDAHKLELTCEEDNE